MKSTKMFVFIFSVLAFLLMVGCAASVPMASVEQDGMAKKFSQPAAGKSGLYVFRDCMVGVAITKAVSLDGLVIGTNANKTFFYREIASGTHQLSTESEFSPNSISFTAEVGKNYFAEQTIKMGVFSGGASLEMVTEEAGKSGVLKCMLAQ